MSNYMKNKTGRFGSNSDSTIKERVKVIRMLYKKYGPLKYDQGYVSYIHNCLDHDKISAGSIRTWLYALEDFLHANGHPDIKIGKPRVTKQEGEYHTPAEAQAIIKAAKNPRDRAIISVLYFAALRIGECSGLRVVDYDAKNHRINVRAHDDFHPKDYEARSIPIPQICCQHLDTWMRFRSESNMIGKSLFLSSRTGEGLSTSRLRGIEYKYAIKAGIKSHPHMLRHARCSYLANEGNVPLPQVQKLMGHSNISVTMKYVHTNVNQLQSSIDALGEITI